MAVSATWPLAVLFLLSAAAASAAPYRPPFPAHHGVNVAGPFVRTGTPPQGTQGQISAFQGVAAYPGWASGADLRRAGYDFIRMPVNPAPLLENTAEVRELLLDEVEAGMRPYLAAGLHVIVDMQFWSPPNQAWTAQNVVASPTSPKFTAYRDLIRQVAARLAHYPQGDVALELLNEPPQRDCETAWILEQRLLLRAVRGVAPNLPVLVSGCQGQLSGLLALDRTKINMDDPNLVFSFHFYEPFLFTHQGGHQDYKFIEDVPFPATARKLAMAMSATIRKIDEARLPRMEALAAKARAIRELTNYAASGADKAFIEKRFDALSAWMKTNDVSPSQVLIGEFSAINWRMRDTSEYRKSRIKWDIAVQAAADNRGVASAYWNLPYPNAAVFR